MPTPLETAIADEIAKLPGGIQKALATEKLAEYVAARAALIASAGSDIVSYSRVGFSATKIDAQKFRDYVTGIETELRQLLYGGCNLIDNRYITP
jgi:hypothetical protein